MIKQNTAKGSNPNFKWTFSFMYSRHIFLIFFCKSIFLVRTYQIILEKLIFVNDFKKLIKFNKNCKYFTFDVKNFKMLNFLPNKSKKNLQANVHKWRAMVSTAREQEQRTKEILTDLCASQRAVKWRYEQPAPFKSN